MTDHSTARVRLGRVLVAGIFILLSADVKGAPHKLEGITLRFVPQESTGASAPTVTPEMVDREVKLVFEDGRAGSDSAIVGEGMTNQDERYPVRATNDVMEFVRTVFEETSASWGVKLSQNADLVLDCKLLRFFVSESDQAVGSTYSADVRLACSMMTSDGATVFQGTSSGDARRYGRSRNENNQNEVLSDAMKESYALMLDQRDLKDAWAGKTQAPVSTAEAMTLDELLQELVDLQGGGLSSALMIQYLNQRQCSEKMTAEDLIKWKEAGLPEDVIQAALGLWG